MNRIRLASGLSALVLLLSTGVSRAGEDREGRKLDGPPLSLRASLETAVAAPGKKFRVNVGVKNASGRKVTFKAMLVTYAEHFVSTSPHLDIVIPPASKNGLKAYTVAPGKAWRRRIEIKVLEGAPRTIRFRLGFEPVGFPRAIVLSAPLEIRVPGGEGDEAPEDFEITAEPSTREVVSREVFALDLQVKNVSSGRKTFRVHGTSWARAWSASDPRVAFTVPNVRREIQKDVTLEPGESWKKTLEVRVRASGAGEMTFRMVFSPIRSERIHVGETVTITVVE